MNALDESASRRTYAFLGPAGTFTEAALLQVPDAAEADFFPCTSVNAALTMVREGKVTAAMVPIENSVEGGVSATLDAIANGTKLQIVREALVPITFVLAVRPGMYHPAQFAKMVATAANFFPGRVRVNVVTGSSPAENAM